MLPEALYLPLLRAVSNVGADLTDDCAAFLEEKLSAFSGTHDEFVTCVTRQASQWFRCASVYPAWIQNAEWPFDQGAPMLFVGQLTVPPASRLFHDEATIFVFVNESGTVKTVLQVS